MDRLKDIALHDEFDWEAALIEQAHADGFPLNERKKTNDELQSTESKSLQVQADADYMLNARPVSSDELQKEIRAACEGIPDNDISALMKEMELNSNDFERCSGKGYDADLDTSSSMDLNCSGKKHRRQHMRSDLPDLSFHPASSDSANSSPVRQPLRSMQDANRRNRVGFTRGRGPMTTLLQGVSHYTFCAAPLQEKPLTAGDWYAPRGRAGEDRRGFGRRVRQRRTHRYL